MGKDAICYNYHYIEENKVKNKDIRRLMRFIQPLLIDKTTEEHIKLPACIYDIDIRANKPTILKKSRTKEKAEVFTPFKTIKQMNDTVDMNDKYNTWQAYVRSNRLEIACGEAPFLTTRYDPENGMDIPYKARAGLFDRKLFTVDENAKDDNKWKEYALIALKSTYGYEYQGDNLLLARINILCAWEEAYARRFGNEPSKEEYLEAIDIITWNLWQMDGLKDCVPETEIPCMIFDWDTRMRIPFKDLKT